MISCGGTLMSNEGFVTTLQTAMIFYRYCARYKVTGTAERLMVMRRLTAKKKAKYIRDANEFIKDKNVMRIDGRKDLPNE